MWTEVIFCLFENDKKLLILCDISKRVHIGVENEHIDPLSTAYCTGHVKME